VWLLRADKKDNLSMGGRSRQRARAILLTLLSIAVIIAIALLVWPSASLTPPNPPSIDTSATSEAARFATTQANRQGTSTAIAQATGTTQAHEREVAAAQTAAAGTAQAKATAQAPPTLTARALAFATARAQAQATVETLSLQAEVAYGPSNGMLTQGRSSEVPCQAVGVALRNFIAQVAFSNPDDTPARPWDYGIVFSNIGEGTDYRLTLDSDSRWALNLHSEGYDITNRDHSDLIDLAPGGSNTLKLFVVGDSALLYINGQYVDTLDLIMFGLGQSGDSNHDVMACAGTKREDTFTGRQIEYTDFTVWSLP
jgi:hypothetical protein